MGGQSGSWTPTKRRGPIAAEFQGPGPAALSLPSLFGNVTIKESNKIRSPAYTFGSRHEKKSTASAPAPNAYNTSGLNPRGKDEPKAPTMHIKPKDPKGFVTPAPGAYNPELAEKDVKQAAPKYSFGIKAKDSKSVPGPAPNAYSLGKALETLHSMPSKSFGIKHSPYVGTLKGDDWVSARTETMSSPVTTKTEYKSVSVSGVPVVNGTTSRESKISAGGGKTTTTTRTHSDGTRIRTETFSYSGPTKTTRVTTAKQSVTKTAA